MTLAASKIEHNDKTLIMLTFPCPKEIIGNIWEITVTGWLFAMHLSRQDSYLCYIQCFSGYRHIEITEKIRLERMELTSLRVSPFAAQAAGGRRFVMHHTLQTVIA